VASQAKRSKKEHFFLCFFLGKTRFFKKTFKNLEELSFFLRINYQHQWCNQNMKTIRKAIARKLHKLIDIYVEPMPDFPQIDIENEKSRKIILNRLKKHFNNRGK